jgi:hypothetical protein
METKVTPNSLLQLLGFTFFIQALIPLIADTVLFRPFVSNENIDTTMSNIANNIPTIYISVVLQIVTAAVIIMLGVAMYMAAGHINKTMGIMALCFYIFEAILLTVSQVFVFGLVKVSQLYSTGGYAGLESLGNVLLSCRDFSGKIAMIPFGLGGILFYYLMMEAKIIPKWLAIWGLVTAPFILVGVPLTAFGVEVSIILLAPYMPFEFFTGIYILIKYRKKSPAVFGGGSIDS